MNRHTSSILSICVLVCLAAAGCKKNREPAPAKPAEPAAEPTPPPPADRLNPVARQYVTLVFQLGAHDKDYVDAYFGPAALREAAEKSPLSLADIPGRAKELLDQLNAIPDSDLDDEARRRKGFLAGSLAALSARAELVGGKKMTFDQESKAIYGAVAPSRGDDYFAPILAKLAKLLPGKGDLAVRYEAYRKRFFIPADKLSAVFDAAIAEARRRTLAHIHLPEGERFSVEYVKGKPWGAYNWYKGNAFSLIQVNTDLPLTVDRALDLACHEGYPGHHTYHSRIEAEFVTKRGWVELSIYPLFSPMSVISEGTANYGIDVAFPPKERLAFERDKLFPLAGLDPMQAATFQKVQRLVTRLAHGSVEAACGLLDGKLDKKAATEKIIKTRLRSRKRAEQNLVFFERYGAYIINYTVGVDLVRDAIERRLGDDPPAEAHWKAYSDIITAPTLPSDLKNSLVIQ